MLSWYSRAAVQGLRMAAVDIAQYHDSQGRVVEAETWFARNRPKKFDSGGWMEPLARELAANESNGNTPLESSVPSTHGHKRQKIQ